MRRKPRHTSVWPHRSGPSERARARLVRAGLCALGRLDLLSCERALAASADERPELQAGGRIAWPHSGAEGGCRIAGGRIRCKGVSGVRLHHMAG